MREQRKAHRSFLAECDDRIPALAAFVFSLKGINPRFLSLQKQLGNIMVMCSDSMRILDAETMCIDEILWELFLEDIEEPGERLDRYFFQIIQIILKTKIFGKILKMPQKSSRKFRK